MLMPATLLEKPIAEDALREVSRIKSLVTEAVEDGVRTALRAVKRGRHVAEDAIDDARHSVKQQPLQAIGIVFAAGVLLGSVITWAAARRR
jgi:ElaB/YqjD/DUF883 family membrane-anchored ribosome-binding protein